MRFSKKIAAVAIVSATVLVAGGALAYWTTGGSGTGSGAAGTSTLVTVAQLDPRPSGLTPGGEAQSIDFSITNTALTNQFVTSVAMTITGVTGANISAGTPCAPGDFTLVQPTATYGDLAPGPHSYVGTGSGATLALNNTSSNQDGCKNAVVALSIIAS